MNRLLLPLAALVSGACASAARAPEPPPSALTTNPVKWSGTFQPQQQVSGRLEPTAKNRAFGSAVLTPLAEDQNRTKVEITLNAQVESGLSLPWGIYPGRCGSGSGLTLPLIASQSLPPLDVGRNGSAKLTTDVSLALPKSGTYQVNVFRPGRANELDGVITCANMRAEEMK